MRFLWLYIIYRIDFISWENFFISFISRKFFRGGVFFIVIDSFIIRFEYYCSCIIGYVVFNFIDIVFI